MSTFSQAHNDYLDPDSHEPPEPPDVQVRDFTLLVHQYDDGCWAVACPEWCCRRDVGPAGLVGAITGIVEEIAAHNATGEFEPLKKSPRKWQPVPDDGKRTPGEFWQKA